MPVRVIAVTAVTVYRNTNCVYTCFYTKPHIPQSCILGLRELHIVPPGWLKAWHEGEWDDVGYIKRQELRDFNYV